MPGHKQRPLGTDAALVTSLAACFDIKDAQIADLDGAGQVALTDTDSLKLQVRARQIVGVKYIDRDLVYRRGYAWLRDRR